MRRVVFAYGSNMNSDRLKQRIKRRNVEWKIGWLRGYTSKFNKLASDGSGYANIEPEASGIVYGVLYLLSEEELQELDECEGVPEHYVRKTVEVETQDGKVCVECYFPNENKIQKGLKPRRDYLDHLIKRGSRALLAALLHC